MSLDLIRWEKQTVTPMHDAIQWDDGRCGILNGCNITHMGANQLKISAGYIVILGRLIEITDTTINVEVSTGAEVNGQLFIRMNLASDNPVEFVTEAAAVLTPLTQEQDANFTNGIYELQLATYKISTTTISGLDVTVPRLEGLGAAVNELNENVSNINVYVGTDGKLHFVDKDGADSVLPFSSELKSAETLISGATSHTSKTTTKDYKAIIILGYWTSYVSSASFSSSCNGGSLAINSSPSAYVGAGITVNTNIKAYLNVPKGSTINMTIWYCGGTAWGLV